jgi:PmbA protein
MGKEGAVEEKELLDRVLDTLRSAGAEGDAYLEHRRTLQLNVREAKLEEISRAEVRGLGIRAMRDGKLGFVHTSVADPDAAVRAAEKACELSRSASTREDLVLAEPTGTGPGDGRDEGTALGIYDPEVETISLKEKEERARAAESAGREFDPKIRRSYGARYSEAVAAHWLANTRGLLRHTRTSWINLATEVVAEEGEEKQPGDAEHQARRLADLPDPEALGRRAGERAVRLLGGRPVETGRYPVVFSPEAGFSLLIYVALALRGDHLSRGRSWLGERRDATIGSPLVTIHDDGRMPGGIGTLPFDAEGVDTRRQTLVEKGRVSGHLLDLASGNRLGSPSTGNATRDGYEELPGIGTHNLYLAPGTADAQEIVGGVERGLWIWNLSGWWIGLDPSNTQFSSAASGLWIEGGVPVRPVSRVTVAGSLEEILGGIELIGNDLVWDHQTKTPTFRVGNLAVSGT